MVPLSARLENDPVELARLDCSVGATTRRQQNAWIILNAILAIMYLAFGLVRLSWPGHQPGMGYVWLTLGVAYLALTIFAFALRYRRDTVQRTTDSTVTISDAGLTFAPSHRALGWNTLQCIVDADGYIVFLDALKNRCAAIARSDLPNGGHDLWRELDDLLMSKRYLVRSTLSHARIVIDKSQRERLTPA